MSLLESLPLEVMYLIVSFLPHVATRSKLSRTSKKVKAMAERLLYQSYQQSSGWQSNSFRPFLRTLVKTPHLAGHLTSLYIHTFGNGLTFSPETALYSPAKPADEEAVDVEIQRMSSYTRDYQDITVARRGDMELALLLVRATNLKDLKIELNCTRNNVRRMVRATKDESCGGSGLRALEKMELTWPLGKGSIDITPFSTWLTRPKVTTFRAQGLSGGIQAAKEIRENLWLRRSCLQDVKLDCTVLSTDCLCALLDGMSTLSHFSLTYQESSSAKKELDFQRVGVCLQAAQGLLQTLIIDPTRFWQFGWYKRWNPIGSFKAWPKLTTLELPQLALIGDQVCKPLRPASHWGGRLDSGVPQDFRQNSTEKTQLGLAVMGPDKKGVHLLANLLPSTIESLRISMCTDSIVDHLRDLITRSGTEFRVLSDITTSGDITSEAETDLSEESHLAEIEYAHFHCV
jgi:hypothetical protein